MNEIMEKEQPGVCILVVEDDSNHRELIVEAVKEASPANNPVCVKDGEEALSYLQRKGQYEDEQKYPKPDLVLLDLKLPGINGKDVLRKIKADEKTRILPVIMLTSSAHDRDVDECYSLGASGYVNKPISFEAFVAIVKTIPFYWTFVNTLPAR
jgi:two-component system response regulator